MARSVRSRKTARLRAKFKAKHIKARLRKAGNMLKRKNGGRLRRLGGTKAQLS